MNREKDGARIILDDGKEYSCDIITDSMGDKSIDITKLRAETGYITYDPGFVNTGSCMSSICYINGEKGILRYRGYDIADLVRNCDFIEVAYLLIKGTGLLPRACREGSRGQPRPHGHEAALEDEDDSGIHVQADERA